MSVVTTPSSAGDTIAGADGASLVVSTVKQDSTEDGPASALSSVAKPVTQYSAPSVSGVSDANVAPTSSSPATASALSTAVPSAVVSRKL